MINAERALCGSKRKQRRKEAEARIVARENRKLNRIRELSRLITSEHELDTFLAAIPDDAMRTATKTLIEPFLLFRIERVDKVLVDSAEKATVQGFHPEIVRPVLPSLT